MYGNSLFISAMNDLKGRKMLNGNHPLVRISHICSSGRSFPVWSNRPRRINNSAALCLSYFGAYLSSGKFVPISRRTARSLHYSILLGYIVGDTQMSQKSIRTIVCRSRHSRKLQTAVTLQLRLCLVYLYNEKHTLVN